ncbi:haloacid dehalogenase-like hydrolase family member protein [Theileria equi strain WA]|uniref:Haloacid dehalogenase-like hydrolase family member protein n=1 Tax=Theileria equi strain WA TaxID=1537102 RepID=L0AZU7_THEEQ|nr:haloacid dehalogenase-like hydrolase family member protein [Theileria equi strain WA]AFZ80526.1 haloacid dehalogenase-like hydrolase family member protein [Theileria equi strain WA]|eukprot:XP_004830192.1 haloacid dehalogenase-like hydrolase family member protein [Theileria equi strain WA]
MRLIPLLLLLSQWSRVTGDGKEEGELGNTNSTSTIKANTSQFLRPKNPPKYFGIDIDGTLLTSDEEAWEKNIEAFAKVRNEGYIPFLCTGNSLLFSRIKLGTKFENKTGYQGYPGVYQNGALVYDENGNVIYSQPFSKEFLKVTHDFLVKNGLTANIVFYDGEELFSLVGDDNVLKNLFSAKYTVLKVLTFEEILKKNILMLKYRDFDFNVPEAEKGIDYVEKMDINGAHDVTPPGGTKALGVTKLLEHYSLSSEYCGFIGDGYNDIEAMNLFPLSFAVANAPDEVKKHAKFVLDKTCDQAAVAEALKLTYGL